MQNYYFSVRKNIINKVTVHVVSNNRNYVYCACYK